MGEAPRISNKLNVVSSEVAQLPKLYDATDLENMNEALYRLNIIYNKDTSAVLLRKTGLTMVVTGDVIDGLRAALLEVDKVSEPRLDSFHAYINTQEITDKLNDFKVYYHDDFIQLRRKFKEVVAFFGQSADEVLLSHVGIGEKTSCRVIKLLGKQINAQIEGYSPRAYAIEKFIKAYETPEGMNVLASDIKNTFDKHGDGKTSKIVRHIKDVSIFKLMEPNKYPVPVSKKEAMNIKLVLALYNLEHS